MLALSFLLGLAFKVVVAGQQRRARPSKYTKEGDAQAPLVSMQLRCRTTRCATLLCWVLAAGGAAATSPTPDFDDLFSTAWTDECVGTSTAWAEVCGVAQTRLKFTITGGFTSAVVFASLERVEHSMVDVTTELRLTIDNTTHVGLSFVRCPEKTACAAQLLHGVVSSLSQGEHEVSLQYKTAAGSAFFRGNGTTTLAKTADGGGTSGARRLSVQVAHADEIVAAVARRRE